MNANTVVACPGLEDVRRYHLARLNDALRRPGMWGPRGQGREAALGLLLDPVAYIDGLETVWQEELDQLRARDALHPTGVLGGFASVLPGYHDDGAVASVYADIAWRHGWLSIDRTLLDDTYQWLAEDVVHWCARDRDLDQVLDELGAPSVWFGGRNPRYSKTLAYATADRSQGLLCLHFAGTSDGGVPLPAESAPVLVAVRQGEGYVPDSFTFTPAGAAYRRATEF